MVKTDYLTISRVFDADRESIFRAWTDPEVLARWFAPPGCEVAVHRMDARLGGEWVTTIAAPGHLGCHCLSVFTEFDPPARFAYTLSFCDVDGRAIPAAEAGRNDWPDQMTVTVTLRDLGAQTEMTLHQTVDAALAEQTGAAPSWRLMFDRLAQELTLP
jgi:uncharacterized protein YndB with AHSA1/START domain